MNNTELVCLSYQLAAYQSMDAIANNLANMSTPAFKRETPQFQEYVDSVRPGEGETGTQSVSYVQQKGMLRDLSAGTIEMTNAPFDCAINGQGYFVIQTANGARYTRNGHFTLDGDGRIVTGDGDPVQGDGGDISISADDGDIHIGADGTVSGAKGQIGKLSVVDFPNDRALMKQGDSLYATTQPSQPATGASIQQGGIESSNVRPVIEMSNMVEVMRSYQAIANLSQSHSDLMRQAIDKLATIQS
jgi:flagellar basal-body rod protein FlgF